MNPPSPIVETPQPLSKRQQKAKLKLEQKQVEESLTTIPSTPPVPPIKTTPIQTKVHFPSESSIPPEEEVNWITISRKQNKHKTPVPSLLSVPIPPKNTKQKMTNTKKTMISNTSTQAQQKVILPTGNSETINRQQQNTIVTPSHQQQKTNYTTQGIENISYLCYICFFYFFSNTIIESFYSIEHIICDTKYNSTRTAIILNLLGS
jgi:hypothetical protein